MRIAAGCWVLGRLWLAPPVRRLHADPRLLAPLALADFEAINRGERPLPESFNFAGDVLDQWSQKEQVRDGGFVGAGTSPLGLGPLAPLIRASGPLGSPWVPLGSSGFPGETVLLSQGRLSSAVLPFSAAPGLLRPPFPLFSSRPHAAAPCSLTCSGCSPPTSQLSSGLRTGLRWRD